MFSQYLWMSFTFLFIRGKYIFIFLPVKRYYVPQKGDTGSDEKLVHNAVTIYLRKSETCMLYI